MTILQSFPFLATDFEQFDPAWSDQGAACEAVVFDREDVMDPARWGVVQTNVRRAVDIMPEGRVLFHFPVNDSNYVADEAVRKRLWECLDFLSEVGVAGLVLHSNQTEPVSFWTPARARATQSRFREFVPHLHERARSLPLWIGLENMPITGNDACELDPTLVFPSDFEGLCSGNVGVTWDVCHYSYTVHVARLLCDGEITEAEDYPIVSNAGFLAFEALLPNIVHGHVSAFSGVARATGRTLCREGVAPWEATVAESTYREMVKLLARAPRLKTMTFEVTEADYRQRPNTMQVMDWCRQIIAGS